MACEERQWRNASRQNWEIIVHYLSKDRWSWGCVSAIDTHGRTIWIVDAHRDDGKRFVVRADEKLTAFMELESAIRDDQRLLQRLVRFFLTFDASSSRQENPIADQIAPAE